MSQADTIIGLGAKTDHVAPVPNADALRGRLTAEEAALLGAVGRAARIQDLIDTSGMGEARTIAVLLALRAKGVIVPAKVAKPDGQAPVVDTAMAEQVDLDDERKREILEVEKILEQDHYRVLGLAPGASAEEIKKAFYERSRKFHPDRFYNRNLGSFRARVERIFKRIAEANRVLTDEERRAGYLAEHPELVAPAPARPASAARPEEDERREAERKSRLARHPYLAKGSRLSELLTRAKDHLAKGEFGMAYSDLNIATQVDPKSEEVQALLAQARQKQAGSRADLELKRGQDAEAAGAAEAAAAAYRSAANLDPSSAKAHFKAAKFMFALGRDPKEIRPLAQRAVELDPKRAEAHALLAQVMLQLGMNKLAQKHFEQALLIDPSNAEAKKHQKKGRWLF